MRTDSEHADQTRTIGLVAELNRMKVLFQARSIAAVMGFPAIAIEARSGATVGDRP